MVELCVGREDTLDRCIADGARTGSRQAGQLLPDIGRGVEQKPTFTICAESRR
jgi:hypothetical protein